MRTDVPEKLLKIVDDIDAKGDVNLTRLTVLKKWFEKPGRLAPFALWIASRASSRKGKTKGDAATLFREARALFAKLERVRPEIDRAAARSLYDRLRAFQNDYRNDDWGAVRIVPNWQLLLVEKGLAIALDRDPSPSAAALVKVAAINAYYGTNLYAQLRMAQHIVHLSEAEKFSRLDPELVDRIAALPPHESGGQKPKKFLSFASKFAHFFLSKEKFPIYDSVAETMLRKHFGRGEIRLSSEAKYCSFVEAIDRLRALADTQVTYVDIDRYLWFTGTYLKWKRGETVNAELQRYFTADRGNYPEFREFQELVQKTFEMQ